MLLLRRRRHWGHNSAEITGTKKMLTYGKLVILPPSSLMTRTCVPWIRIVSRALIIIIIMWATDIGHMASGLHRAIFYVAISAPEENSSTILGH
jgi:hypothetical protein